jgi:hypothetical protein
VHIPEYSRMCVPSGPTCAVCCSFQCTFAGCALVHFLCTGKCGKIAKRARGKCFCHEGLRVLGMLLARLNERKLGRAAHGQISCGLASRFAECTPPTTLSRLTNANITTRLTHYKLPVSNIVSPSKSNYHTLRLTPHTIPFLFSRMGCDRTHVDATFRVVPARLVDHAQPRNC